MHYLKFAIFIVVGCILLQNKKLKKVSLHKDQDGSLGIRLIGGKGTKFGDTGLFVAKLEKDRPADRYWLI